MTVPRLTLRGVEARYFDVPVLDSIELAVFPGEAVGLVGENGAGKSTLMKIIGGLHRPSAGEMTLEGQPYVPQSPLDAQQKGVAMVHQELNLFPNLTVAENVFVGGFPRRRFGLSIDRRTMRERTAEVLARVGLDISPDCPLRRLSPGQRQLVEIAKGLARNATVLMLDEPTSSLTDHEAERLFELLGDLKRQNVSLLYVSHSLNHVLRLCDKVVVLRDGVVQATGPSARFTLDELITLMVGRRVEQVFPQRPSLPHPEAVMRVEGLTQPGVLRDVSLTLHRGEVVGLSGLMGSGRSELARILFGLDPFAEGRILLNGAELRPSPRRAIRRGMALVTESRRDDGLLLSASIEENTQLASLDRFSSRFFGWFRRRAARSEVRETLAPLMLKSQSLEGQAVATLSGGNQQKVVLAKWLLTRPRVVILDEPTRGIDVGAKFEVYRVIDRLTADGVAVLVISSELEELMGLCDRILVMAGGELRHQARRDDFDRERLLREAFGKERGA